MKFPQSIAALSFVALNACATQSAAPATPAPTNDTRLNLAKALANMGTSQQGIQQGKNSELISSIACESSTLEDSAKAFAENTARKALIDFACPAAPSGPGRTYVPILHDASQATVGDTVCVRVSTVKHVVCNGKSVELKLH